MIHKFPYYNLMMADPGEGGGGGGDDGGGNPGIARLVANGIDCGEIVEIGSVEDYFPNGATTIPSTETYEMASVFSGGGIGFNHSYFRKLQKQCVEYPGIELTILLPFLFVNSKNLL